MSELRIGQGLDIHRLVAGRALILGGIKIPFEMGLEGHSDADVVLHALIDALLGAAGLPDIGQLFPNTDRSWKDADSRKLLALAWERVRAAGWELVNADVTVLAERPKLSPYIPQMKVAISEVLTVAADCINIKATTAERLGFVGREEGMLASAVALLSR